MKKFFMVDQVNPKDKINTIMSTNLVPYAVCAVKQETSVNPK